MMGDPLDLLEDIIVPEPIGWWPLASSVWVTLFILLAVLVGLVWYFWQRHKKAAYRRYALSQMENFNQLSDSDLLNQLNALLKQVAITTYGRAQCGGLNHQAWLRFLHQKASFVEQPKALAKLEQRYQAQPPELSAQEREALIYFAKRWIREHHL
jgi:predicted negative regulator of RcsB-dependent stress response